jgi:four helix bundle protein
VGDGARFDQLEKRIISFSADIVLFSSRLPKSFQAQHIARQISRSGTAVAANYGEARGAESRSDFIHKLRIVLKELNETAVWLEIILHASLFSPDATTQLLAENRELCRIMVASIRTARHSAIKEM